MSKQILRLLKNKKGVSLAELMVVTVILLLVLSVTYTVYFFSTLMFDKGSTQTALQYDIRTVADLISNEIRNSTDLEIINRNDIPTSQNVIPDTVEYIYLSNEGTIIRKNKHSVHEMLRLNDSELSLNFTNSSDNLLKFDVTNPDNPSYSLASEIHILNIAQGFEGKIISSQSNGNAIRYQIISPNTATLYASPYHVPYGDYEDKQFIIRIQNAEFQNNISKQAISFGGILAELDYNVIKNNFTELELEVTGEFSGSDEVRSGTITILGNALNGTNGEDLTVRIYTTKPTVRMPTTETSGNNILSDTPISLSSQTDDADIYYTLDGNSPTTSSEQYTVPIIITGEIGTQKTLKAIGIKDHYEDSGILEEVYTIVSPSALLKESINQELIISNPTAVEPRIDFPTAPHGITFVFSHDNAFNNNIDFYPNKDTPTHATIERHNNSEYTGKIHLTATLTETSEDRKKTFNITVPEDSASDLTVIIQPQE